MKNGVPEGTPFSLFVASVWMSSGKETWIFLFANT